MQVKTKNLLLGGVVALLVVSLWYSQVYSKMEHQASKAKSAAAAANAQADTLKHQLAGETATNKKNANGPTNSQLLEAVPAGPAEAAFLRNVDQLRVTSGVAWQSITPNVSTPATGLNSNSVAINVRGTEEQIARYMIGLSQLRRVFVLDNVTINENASTGPAGAPAAAPQAGATFLGQSFNVTLTGRIFSEPTAPAAGTTGTGVAGSTTPATGAPAPTGGSAAQSG